MEKMGWSTADFVREFGRNYLDEGAGEEAAASGEALIPSGASSASSPWSPRGAYGRTEASAPTGAETGFEVTDFELCVCVNW